MELNSLDRGHLLSILRKTGHDSGLSFLEKTCVEICRQFGFASAFVGQLDQQNSAMINVRCGFKDESILHPFSYKILGSASEEILSRSFFVCQNEASNRFPSDQMLAEFGMISVMGLALKNANQENIGVFVVMNDDRLTNLEALETTMVILSARIESELERMTFEQERKKQQNERNQNEKIELLGRFASGISRDLNNVLMGISGNLQVFKTRYAHSEVAEDQYLSSAVRASERSLNLLKQISMIAKVQKSEKKIFNISDLGRTVFFEQAFRAGSRIKLRVTSEPANIEVIADPLQIEQIFLNLLLNAITASEQMGGDIELKLSKNSASEVIATVSDNGVGIPNHLLDRIFEPFFSLNPSKANTGLGLAIVKNLVQLYKGRINVKSELDLGTSIEVTLPIGVMLTNSEIHKEDLV